MPSSTGNRGEDRIPMFDGRPGNDFNTWFRKFKTGAAAMNWDTKMQILQIPTFFTGLAEIRWNGIDEDKIAAFTLNCPPDANDIKVFLTNMFPDRGGPERNATKLYNCQQGTRTVADYVEEFETLAQKAFKEPIGDSHKRHLFVRGLTDELRRNVQFKNPTTFEKALDDAIYFETLDLHVEPSFNAQSGVMAGSQFPFDDPICNQCGMRGHTQYQCRSGPLRKNDNYQDDCFERHGFPIERRWTPNGNPREYHNASVYGSVRHNGGKFFQGNRSRKGLGAQQRRTYGYQPKEATSKADQKLQQQPVLVKEIYYPGYKFTETGQGSPAGHRVGNDLSLLREEFGPKTIVKLRVHGVKTIALFDSGATCSIISEELAHRLPTHITWVRPTTKANSVSGHPLSFTKSADLQIDMEGDAALHTMHVLPKSPYPCILGTDFFKIAGSITIDYGGGFIQMENGTKIPLLIGGSQANEEAEAQSKQGRKICLVASQTTTLEPWSQTCLWIKAEGAKNGDECAVDIFEIAPRLRDKGIKLARSLGKVIEGHIPVTFLNTSLDSFSLYEKASVGAAELLEKGDVNQLNSISHVPVGFEDRNTLENLDLSKSDLTQPQKGQLERFLRANANVFGRGRPNPGQTSKVTHHIDTGDSAPIHVRAHRTPFSQKEKVKKMVEEMVKSKVAKPSASPWASPIILVKKKSGEDRFCVDYRQLNDITKKDTYPLPKISELLDSLGKSKFFTTLDLDKGYWQIPMNPKDKEKTAFVTSEGLFEFNVMPFGLTNAPATFQRMMDVALAGLQPDSCLVYMDDIIVFSETFEQHIRKIGQVFERLKSYGLKLNMKKCQFARQSVIYLGHQVSKHGLQPDPTKIELIKKWPVPKSEKALERFMGLASYYRRFVKGFSTIAAPLHELKQKEMKFVWSPECQKAFEILRNALMTPPLLAFPDFNRPFVLETDASGTGLGAILSQEFWDSQKQRKINRPVAYASRVLNKTERNYHATEREALAIIWALKNFRTYIYGTPVKLISDHAPLQWLMTKKNQPGKLSRWAIQLQEYDLVKDDGKAITYKPGKKISHVDACSRVHEINTFIPNDGALQIDEEQKKDKFCSEIRKRIEDGENIMNFFVSRGLLHHCPKMDVRESKQFISQIVVPMSLRENVLRLCHDNLFGGHMGMNRTYDRVALRYFWPGMKSDCEKWVASCVLCQKRKGPRKENKEFLTPIPVTEPFSKVVVDVLGPLSQTENGNRFVVIFTDHFTKYVEAFATADHKAETIAKLLVSKIICRHGAPCELLSDQGPEFMSALVKEICTLCDVAKINSTAYHPLTQGLTERFNRTILGILKAYTNDHQTDWDKFIPFALFAYHTSKQKSLGESPFFMVYGRDARMPSDVAFQAKRPIYVDLDENLEENVKYRFSMARELAKDSLERAQETMKRNYDYSAKKSVIREGDLVSLHRPAVPPGFSPKLWVHWTGPLRALEIKTPNALIQDINMEKSAFWVHMNRLKPYVERYAAIPKFSKETRNENLKMAPQKTSVPVAPEHIAIKDHVLRSGKTYGNSAVNWVSQLRHPYYRTRYFTNSQESKHAHDYRSW